MQPPIFLVLYHEISLYECNTTPVSQLFESHRSRYTVYARYCLVSYAHQDLISTGVRG